MDSLWLRTSEINRHQPLDGDKRTDVLVIGAGMAGILCAHHLQQAGVKVTVVDSGEVGKGITKNTTAKITSQHGLIYDKLIKTVSKEAAQKYFQANEQALENFKGMCLNIECDFEEKPAFIYSLDDRRKIEKEVAAVQCLGFDAEFMQALPLPFKTVGAIKFKRQAQFHPLKFIASLSQNLKVYQNTLIRKISGNTAFTRRGKIIAEKIIITSHFPFIDMYGFYFAKMYQCRSYVIALENSATLDGMYLDEKQNGMSFRQYEELMLIGGGGHRTGKKGGGFEELRKFANKYYPYAQEKYSWAAQDCMTLDDIPYIGQYSRLTPNLFVATGFNKWGMTSSMVSAMILKDLILGKKNEYAELFLPSRSMFKPQLLVNLGESIINLLTPSTKRCTHLGCALKWNKTEKTWDCPCHGSRFDTNGRVIDNPSIRRANID